MVKLFTRLGGEMMEERDRIAGEIIGAAIEVHRRWDPGCWNRHMRNVCVMNSISGRSNIDGSVSYR